MAKVLPTTAFSVKYGSSGGSICRKQNRTKIWFQQYNNMVLVYTIGNGVEHDLGKKRTSEQTQIDNMHTREKLYADQKQINGHLQA
jgi:hypothetical protein